MDEKLGLLEENLHLFPKDLRVMSVILIHTGVEKGERLYSEVLALEPDAEVEKMFFPSAIRRYPG